MGLAASQARFLGLTARKSNVEYKGQQINQQRTALSNEVMGLYQEYNKLKVPTAPSIEDFQKTTYTLESAPQDYEIQSFTKILDGEYAGYYDVMLSYPIEVPMAYTSTKSVVLNYGTDESGINSIKMNIGAESYIYELDSEGNPKSTNNITKFTIQDKEELMQTAELATIYAGYEGEFPFNCFQLKINGLNYYTTQDSLLGTDSSYNGNYTFDYQGIKNDVAYASAKAALTQDQGSGRLTAIQILESEDAPDLVNHVYSIKTGNEDNQNAYNDALNEYNYNKAVYEKEIEEINHKTKMIQEQDRALELELNQLNTEQKALATEMDAVSEVIKNTIDSVFKTFNS